MDDKSQIRQAVELLQRFGLKEYEAKAFVALTRRETGTAKEISETSEVPRTRVYDAIRVLESKGLVETQHSNPQVFRAVSLDEAIDIIRTEYEERAESLRRTLGGLDPVENAEETDVTHEVWAVSGTTGIVSRTGKLIDDAEQELIFVIGERDVFTDAVADRLQEAHDRGIEVTVGTIDETLRTTVRSTLPDVEVFVSGLEWLKSSSTVEGDDTEISRLMLVDRESILVSSFTQATGDGRGHEQAVFGRGFDNGLVVIVRRLMATGLAFEREA